jgi:hypothetical protein
MKLQPTLSGKRCAKSGCAGFTLAEALAALAFMAIVIPVAVQGLKVANLSGQVAERKGEAMRVAERVLNETMITTNWVKSLQSGTIQGDSRQYRWQVRNDPWIQDPMRLVTVQVNYTVQGQEYDVRVSTLADTSQ